MEKMYKADDLVEESEEIILKRQKFAVEFAQYSLQDAKQDAESQREREALLKVHEIAAAWFREQLAAPPGAAATSGCVSGPGPRDGCGPAGSR